MRGRRAFVVLTVYLVLLAVFAWMVALYLEQVLEARFDSFNFASAEIGRGVFGAMLLLETLLVVLLAPAFTAGSISMEREKQTLDLLTATPISSFAIVVGKLFSALTYLFLLIAASVPLTALVFVFGGVAPDDVVTGYFVLVVTAIGFGTLGLACSAVVRRTQAATVIAYTIVLALTLGTRALWVFWMTMGQPTFGVNGGPPIQVDDVGQIATSEPAAPEALLWLNPFMAQLDVICGTQSQFSESCRLVAEVTGRSLFGGGVVEPQPMPFPVPVPEVQDKGGVLMPDGAVMTDGNLADAARALIQVAGRALPRDLAQVEQQPFGTLRDAFWPQFVAAWAVASIVLVLLSVQLVSPTRRWRFRRRGGRRTTEIREAMS
jgi:ABC-type transport system involved in multi-copper enzyme maturation permease subunit